ncbi:cyanophycin synthetase [soil metagenome]
MNDIMKLYASAARALKLPFEYREEYDGIEVYLAKRKYYFRGGYTPFNEGSSDNISLNKYSVNRLLHNAGFPVPHVLAISTKEYINGTGLLPNINYPIVAKPTANTSCGLDVFCNIKDDATLIQYLNRVKEKYSYINIEKFEGGLTAYRVLVFFNKVIAVTERHPACVTGDGKHTIAELIKIKNAQRATIKNVTVGNLKVDEEYETKLKEMNITLDYIPKINETVTLCYVCNSTRGGTMTSLGRSICPENAKLVCRAAKLLNLNVVGFDINCEDIQRPIEHSRGFFIEANSNPDITIHEAALAGMNVPVTKIFLQKIIRRHLCAYLWAYFRQTLHPHGFYFRAALVSLLLFSFMMILHYL